MGFMSRFIILILLFVSFSLDLPQARDFQLHETTSSEVSPVPEGLIPSPLIPTPKSESFFLVIIQSFLIAPLRIDRSLEYNQHINLPPPYCLS